MNKTGGECIIQNSEDGKAVISEELCTGCGICIKKCPFDAIVIVNLAKELGEDKIHQFGINTFRLISSPFVKKRFSRRPSRKEWNGKDDHCRYSGWKHETKFWTI